MIQVAVLHDAELVRAGIRHLLESQDDVEVPVTSAADGWHDLPRATDGLTVLCDFSRGVSQLARQVMQVRRDITVLGLVAPSDAATAMECIEAGARGAFCARTAPSTILEAIRRVGSGGTWLSPELMTVVLSDYQSLRAHRAAARARIAHLRQPERTLLELVAAGRSNADIAEALHVAVSTVKDQVGSLLLRLGGCTRAEAIALGNQAHWVGADAEAPRLDRRSAV